MANYALCHSFYLREGVKKNVFLGDFSQTWVGGGTVSQIKITNSGRTKFTFCVPKSHKNPGVGIQCILYTFGKDRPKKRFLYAFPRSKKWWNSENNNIKHISLVSCMCQRSCSLYTSLVSKRFLNTTNDHSYFWSVFLSSAGMCQCTGRRPVRHWCSTADRQEGGGEEVHLDLPLPLLLNIMGGGAEHRIRQSTDQDVAWVMIHLPTIIINDDWPKFVTFGQLRHGHYTTK